MAKLLFRESPFTNTVIRSLDNSLEYLNNANRQIYSINIPNDFRESGNLKKCLEDVQSIKKEITSLKTWGTDSCRKINNAIQNTNSVASLLPKTQLQVRNLVVR